MSETQKRPLQDVDLYHLSEDGLVSVTNIRGGLSGIKCETIEDAQAWVDDLYPDAKPLASQRDLNDIANQRYEDYMSKPYEGSAFVSTMLDAFKELAVEDQVLAACVKSGVPASVGQRYLEEESRWD